jgi:hypothetical protein
LTSTKRKEYLPRPIAPKKEGYARDFPFYGRFFLENTKNDEDEKNRIRKFGAQSFSDNKVISMFNP